MKKEVKIVCLLLTLIFLIIICSLLLSSNKISYKVKHDNNKFIVHEINSGKFYKINIQSKKSQFNFQIENNNYKRKIISDLYYYIDDEYECLLPVVNKNIIVDMICYNGNISYNYHDIIGKSLKLDNFVDKIDIYSKNKFINDESEIEKIDSVNIYKNNKINKTVAITTYKGLIVHNQKIELFKKDVYNNKISTFLNNYYIIADYDSSYEFNCFYVVNLDNGNINKLKSKIEISFDSYIQGVVDDKIYLYDIDNENQYEIDILNNKIKLISSNTVKYYTNKKWEEISKAKANNQIYFDYETLDNDFSDYDKVIKTDYYYYLFKDNGINYDLFRVSKNTLNEKKYLLKLSSNDINVKDNYLYYKEDNKIYYYSDETGLKSIMENTELRFNNTIKYYIY